MRPASKRAESRKISPHTGFETSTVTAGGASSPTLRGFRKCSISCGDIGENPLANPQCKCTAGGLATGVLMFWKRYLPHFTPEGQPVFVTWRSAGSIPVPRAALLKNDPNPGKSFAEFD